MWNRITWMPGYLLTVSLNKLRCLFCWGLEHTFLYWRLARRMSGFSPLPPTPMKLFPGWKAPSWLPPLTHLWTTLSSHRHWRERVWFPRLISWGHRKRHQTCQGSELHPRWNKQAHKTKMRFRRLRAAIHCDHPILLPVWLTLLPNSELQNAPSVKAKSNTSCQELDYYDCSDMFAPLEKSSIDFCCFIFTIVFVASTPTSILKRFPPPKWFCLSSANRVS